MRINYIIYSAMYFGILLFVGVFNLAFADWDLNALKDANYWYQTLTTSATYIIAYQVSVNMAADIYTEKFPLYVSTKESVEKAVKGNLGNDFYNSFVPDYNFRNKRKTWETKIRNKLTKLNNRTSQRTFNKMRLKPEEEWGYFIERYRRKKARFELQLTDEWIKENLPYIKLKYPQITAQEIATGEVRPNNRRRLIDNNVATYGLGRKLALLTVTIGFNAILTAMIITGTPFSAAIAIKLVIQLLIIGVNILSGFFTGVDGFKKKRLTSLFKRQEIIIEYLSGPRKD